MLTLDWMPSTESQGALSCRTELKSVPLSFSQTSTYSWKWAQNPRKIIQHDLHDQLCGHKLVAATRKLKRSIVPEHV
jgi:hypothetical protein